MDRLLVDLSEGMGFDGPMVRPRRIIAVEFRISGGSYQKKIAMLPLDAVISGVPRGSLLEFSFTIHTEDGAVNPPSAQMPW